MVIYGQIDDPGSYADTSRLLMYGFSSVCGDRIMSLADQIVGKELNM